MGEASERGSSRMPGLPSALRQFGNPRSFLQQARTPDIFELFSSEFQLDGYRPSRLSTSSATAQSQQTGNREATEEGVSISIEVGEERSHDTNDGSIDEDESTRPNAETVALLSMVQRYLPFALIIAAKALFDHGIGLLVFAALLVTFSHANSRLKREVALQARRSLGGLAFLAGHVAACIALLYAVFEDQRLYTSLWLSHPLQSPLSLLELLWFVTVTDFVLKLITIVVKTIVAALPARILIYPRRGSVFLAIEASSQLYRALAPLQPWLCYLLEAYHGAYKLVGVCLSAAYLVCKGRELVARFKIWRDASVQLCAHSSLGEAPSAAQLGAAGSMCTICHENFTTPVCLPCSHVFCEGCLAAWADREPSCPLCRARFGADPAWRDGATSFFMQVF